MGQFGNLMLASVLLLAPCIFTGVRAQTSGDLLGMLGQLGQMTPQQQDTILIGVGILLMQKTGMTCNIFAGPPFGCQAIATNSSYLQQCGAQASPSVDCAFTLSVQHNVYDSPVDNLEQYLKDVAGLDARTACPQCFDVLQSLWCAMAVPKCGAFRQIVHHGLIPLMVKASDAYTNGLTSTQMGALAYVMGDLLNATAAALPCREMCEAVTHSCSCASNDDTIGQLLQWLAGRPEMASALSVPVQYSRVLFKDVWNQPLCSLFPSQSDPSFTGSCNIPSATTCTNRNAWCSVTTTGQKPDAFRYVQSLILLQLVRANLGWLTDDNQIIWGMHEQVSKAVSDATAEGGHHGAGGSSQSSSAGGGMPAGQVVGIVFLSLVCGSLMTIGAVVGFRRWKQKKAEAEHRTYFQLTETDEQDEEHMGLIAPNASSA